MASFREASKAEVAAAYNGSFDPTMDGSTPATCSAIGSAGIPEICSRGYSGGFAAGIIAADGALRFRRCGPPAG